MVFLRTAYNYDMAEASFVSGLECLDESLTKQSEKEAADINTIVRRFKVTGELPTGVRKPTYGDFTGVGTFLEAMTAINAAEASFLAMPAAVRKRFDNDPEQFVRFCSDPRNEEEARRFGLVDQAVVEAAADLAPVAPAPAEAPTSTVTT